MLLGALLDAGLPLAELRALVATLDLPGVAVEADRVDRGGIGATRFRVLVDGASAEAPGAHEPRHGDRHAHAEGHEHGHGREHEHQHGHELEHGHERDHGHEHGQELGHDPEHRHDHGRESGRERGPGHEHGGGEQGHGAHGHGHGHGGGPAHSHRSLSAITAIVERSGLSASARERAVTLFTRLAQVEADIHRVPVEEVHLHEVGAVDSIVDIVGSVFALEWFAPDRVVASPLNVGSGTVRCEHGELPVPAPATVRLVEGAPIYSSGPPVERLTPTGALLVTGYAAGYGGVPPMTVRTIGYGAGRRDLAGTPNALRVLVGDDGADSAGAVVERVAVVECEIDDMNPQIYGVLMDRLRAAGAMDAYYTPIQMKKNRPGTLVTVLAASDRRHAVSEVLFAETTTLGVRTSETTRECLERHMVEVDTPLGTIPVKVARRGGAVFNAAPEFEDCVRVAETHGLSVKQVHAVAMKAYLDAR
ncbi:MAG: nickel pincer cofactor biosynthesis protein LarC [Acidobacteria bacterium]|nr:nickel pincer cofactor biosynthesis protein LarC [Acidobacteriota bacterium]